jgi:hypothetical protein
MAATAWRNGLDYMLRHYVLGQLGAVGHRVEHGADSD